MCFRARAVLLASTALAVVAVSSATGPVLAASAGDAPSHTPSGDQPLTWSIVPSPNTSKTLDNSLTGVSCSSRRACAAVGYYQNGLRGLIESWNGTRWSIVHSPHEGHTLSQNILTGVSCVSARDCVAVGYHIDQINVARTVIASWNGARWSIVPSPNNGTARVQNYLYGVSCISADACTAVGSTRNSPRSLIESWNGTTWSIVHSPNPRARDLQGVWLSGVSCTSATTCTAVGYYEDSASSQPGKTVVESWNGTTWSIVPSPNPGSSASTLFGVSCATASACTAAGYDANADGPLQTLIESWNGTTWSAASSPDPSPIDDLLGVSCASPTSCTVVGYQQADSTARLNTLIESWNGTTWSVVPSPNRGGGKVDNGLTAASCVSTATCIAVGSYGLPHTVRTLAEIGESSAASGRPSSRHTHRQGA